MNEQSNSPGHSLRLLSVKQLSAETGLPTSTIYKLVEAEQIPFHRPGPGKKRGKVYFRPAEIEAWLDSSRHAPQKTPELKL